MKELLENLTSWKGPDEFGKEIRRRGLHVPEIYRNELTAYCVRAGCDTDLETYWAEYSKERIFSACRSDPDRRYFINVPYYRSKYLDELAEKQYPKPLENGKRLHPCLRRWMQDMQHGDKDLWPSLWDKIENIKIEEAHQFGINGDGWTGKKKDVKPILRRFAEGRGFLERKLEKRGLMGKSGRAFCKQNSEGLLFYIWVDTGGFPDASVILPLEFAVGHVDDKLGMMMAGPALIYEGADLYARFKSALNAVLGIYALVEIFDAFSCTFK